LTARENFKNKHNNPYFGYRQAMIPLVGVSNVSEDPKKGNLRP